MDLALEGLAPIVDMTRSTLSVSRKGILCFETTGTIFSLTPKSFAISFATSTS